MDAAAEASKDQRVKPLKFAIITPSYAPDFEHCRLLCESVLQYVPESVHHYLLVDRRDVPLFSELRATRTHLITKEELLPWWLVQLPFGRKWWLNFRGLPVRGWVLQQLTKLSVNRAVDADVYIFLDSGAFFVRPYDPHSLTENGKVPLLREDKPEWSNVPWNIRWHQVSARLLGLPVKDYYQTGYVGNLVYWRREHLSQLHTQIEQTTGRDWVASVANQLRISEYTLYGVFAEHVLGDASGHYFYDVDRSLNHWALDDLDTDALRQLKAQLAPHVAVVMINEKARIPISRIRQVFLET